MPWRTSISGGLTLGQGSGRRLSRRSARINSNPADPALWKEDWARKSKDSQFKEIVIHITTEYCTTKLMDWKSGWVQSDRPRWKPGGKCACGACPGIPNQVLVHNGEVLWEKRGREWRNTVAMTGHYIPSMSLTIPTPIGGCSSGCTIYFFCQSRLVPNLKEIIKPAACERRNNKRLIKIWTINALTFCKILL